MSDHPAMLGLPALKGRGWTPAMIRRLLGEPDRPVPNPHYRSAAPVRLYAVERIQAAEQTAEFRAAQAMAALRSAATTRAMGVKRAKLRAEIEAWPVTVQPLAPDQLRRRALDHYNGRLEPGDPLATADRDPAFLARIEVNFLRHRLTRYDRKLDRLGGRIGRAEGERLIRRKVYVAIAEAYPHLADECARQLGEREAYDAATPADADRGAA